MAKLSRSNAALKLEDSSDGNRDRDEDRKVVSVCMSSSSAEEEDEAVAAAAFVDARAVVEAGAAVVATLPDDSKAPPLPELFIRSLSNNCNRRK